MSNLYAQTASHLGWLTKLVEEALEASVDATVVDRNFLRRLKTNQFPSDEEIKAVSEALVELGILRRDGSVVRLNRAVLLDRKGYCDGVRDAVEVLGVRDKAGTKLCATIPNGLDSLVEKALRQHTSDLRSTLLDLIASAERRIVLASPFWDLQTANELTEPLIRRLRAGVTVDLLGRFHGEGEESGRLLQSTVGSYEKCQLFAWHERGKHGTSKLTTFHFKAAVVDNATRAYLGTANLTASSLRSVMELGVILTGEAAEQLLAILNVILSIASPLKAQNPSA